MRLLIKAFDVRDITVAVGMLALGTGLAFFDWRVALITIGVLVILLGTAGRIIKWG